jgi:putative addiction module component (TIGR02574 family)
MRSADEILNEALSLPANERAALAGTLIESLDDDATDEDFVGLWSAEIKRRIDDLDAGRVQRVPWSQVRQRLFER